MSPMPALISARELAWEARGCKVVGPLDFELERGGTTVLLGPNGAGKTTLLRLLARVLPPSQGKIFFEGAPYTGLSRRELARRLSYVPQVRPESVPFTVGELVLQGRFPHLPALAMAPSPADHDAVERALLLAGVTSLKNRALDELSGGERQSAYIAAALAQEAPVLLLDEPTTHLDPRHQRSVVALVKNLALGGDHTVLMATHDLRVAAAVADRVVALKEGRVLATGPPGELLSPPALARLFDAPFRTFGEGGQSFPVLELEP